MMFRVFFLIFSFSFFFQNMLLFLILLLWCFSDSHFVIPAGVSPDGKLHVNGSIFPIPGFQNISIGLTPYENGRLHRVCTESELCHTRPRTLTIQLSDNFSFFDDNYLLCEFSE